MDYKNGKIYKLQCEDGHFYIGSTATELRKRLNNHKTTTNRSTSKVYQYLQQYGWDKVRIVLIEEYPCENKQQLVRKEDEYIRQHLNNPLCLNHTRSFRTPEEIKEYHDQYYHQNKEEITQKRQIYRQEHLEEKRAYEREYMRVRRANKKTQLLNKDGDD